MPRLIFEGRHIASLGARRRRILMRLAVSLVSIAIIPELCTHRVLVINTSPSVAPGLYLRSSEPPAVGTLVDFRIPAAARPYVYRCSGNSGEDWYILKPVAAGPGDRINTMGQWLIINDKRIAPMPPPTDNVGRSLPVWRDCRSLRNDEFFVFSNRIPNSFDSRCYGPVRRDQISAVRKALICW